MILFILVLMMNKLDKLFNNSKIINVDNESKIVIMSDCHRGAGDSYDNFFKNQNLFKAALKYYYDNGFTYIELGDGDELWEVKDCKDIIDVHLSSFKLMKKFYDDNRFYMLSGNHDIVKNNSDFFNECFSYYYDNENKEYVNLFGGMNVYESLVLKYYDKDIFLVHGHQLDFLNGSIWLVARFLVRNVWKPLEHLGVNDLTGAGKNYHVYRGVDKKLKKWSINNNTILIAGHTHRAIFPMKGDSLYFNDGSCVYPNGITCIEIENGNIVLVRWEFEYKDNMIFASRIQISEEVNLLEFYK